MTLKTITYKRCIIEIHSDEDAENPREEWDNAGHMLCRHSRYNLGDGYKNGKGQQPTVDEILEITKRPDVIWMPLYLYDHSGLRMRSGSVNPGIEGLESRGRFTGDGAGWDTSTVGIIYITHAEAVKGWGKKRFTKKVFQKAVKYLEGEVQTYNDYLSGNVVGYVTNDPDGEQIDSCWGFYPEHESGKRQYDYMLREAEASIDYWRKNRLETLRAERRTRSLALCGSAGAA